MRGERSKDVEIVVLRHQVAVLRSAVHWSAYAVIAVAGPVRIRVPQWSCR